MSALLPYVPRLVATWPDRLPPPSFQEIEGSMAFVDVSGFTKMSERLARRGKVGAEEVAEVIGSCFSALLGVAYAEDGGLLKFGGDALLLFFPGEDHAARATRAAARMRRTLREIGRIRTSAGAVTLRMSVGIHSGTFHLFLVGGSHHELIVAGPAATRTVEMEAAAEAGQILLSTETAAALPARNRGAAKGPGVLLAGTPPGVSLGAAPSSPLGLGDVSAAVPAAIREHLQAGGGDPEHRLVSIAFVHAGGLEAHIAARGPAAARDELHALVEAAQGAASEHGVTFLGSDISADGTKLILAAGAPSARGDDEERLLRATLAIVGAGGGLHARIGVHRGHVFAGDIGPPYRRTYTVMGDAVNLAARLMQHASPDEVLATAAVLDPVRGTVEREALPPFTVKGKARPVQAFRVGAVRRGQRTQDRPPLVGRRRELSVLLEALAETRRGEARAIEIVGEPGAGKSRLVGELLIHAGDLPRLALVCEPYEASTPYHPFRAGLRAQVGIPEGASDDDAAGALGAVVDARVPALRPWLPLLAIPLGLELEPTAETAALDERFRRPQLHRTLRDLLGALLEGPALITIEDAHWMDDASAELLAELAGDRALPWLVCATRRDAPTPLRLPEAHTIALEPLDAQESAALVASQTEEMPLHPHEVEALTRRAQGNPLFLRQLLAARREAAGPDAGGAVLVGAEALPESVEAAIAVRIDQLPPGDRTALRRLSVLGPAFDRALVPAVLPDDPDALDRLSLFLEPAGRGGLRFRHALIRDAAYQGLPFRLRQELHELVGGRIERQAFPEVDAHAEVLALHFSEAGSHGSAWIYARVAARRAAAIFANVEAASFYERALAAARRLDAVTPEATAELWEALGDVRQRMGEFPRATRAYRTTRALLRGDAIAEARLLLKEAWVARRAGRFSDALRSITRARTALAGVPGEAAARERARLSGWYASIRQEQGRSADAVRWCLRAIDEATASGAREALAHASYVLDWAYVLQGRLDLATNSERALAIYEELGDLAGQANVLNNLGGFAYERGRWDEAIAYYERARQARERTGDAVNAAFGTINVAEILADQGRLEEAEARIRDGLRVWRAAGDRAGTAFALALLGRVLARAGRTDEALPLLDEARREFAFVGATADVVGVDARIAECALLAGDPRGAASLAEQALERAVQRAAVFRPLLLRVLGQARLETGDRRAALAALEESLAEARGRQADYEGALTMRALAEAVRLEGDAEHARALEADGSAVLERLGVVTIPSI